MATEVHLQLVPRLTVVDAHRRLAATPAAQILRDVALHRPGRHVHAAAAEQLGDLHARDIVRDPGGDLVVMGDEKRPGLATAVDAVRNARLPPPDP
jgi:hypothetical protein